MNDNYNFNLDADTFPKVAMPDGTRFIELDHTRNYIVQTLEQKILASILQELQEIKELLKDVCCK